MHRSFYYYIATAATTAIAGILHLIWASSIMGKSPPTFSIFFIVSGIAQVFWALPMIKQWGRIWYYIGIAGTAILVILYGVTRVPNPLTEGRPAPTEGIGIAIMVFQIAYIAITAIILVRERRMKVSERQQIR
ncbi:MAG TPA: hypothetical protein VJ729_02955 [Nitrososphaeraceae archaeon]|nr:hypothetical protein [Nitrososphaeraceae archaeon]